MIYYNHYSSRADLVIDTSEMSVYELTKILELVYYVIIT